MLRIGSSEPPGRFEYPARVSLPRPSCARSIFAGMYWQPANNIRKSVDSTPVSEYSAGMTQIHIWQRPTSGHFYWDFAEDDGLAVTPEGPYEDIADLKVEAQNAAGWPEDIEFLDGLPDRYIEAFQARDRDLDRALFDGDLDSPRLYDRIRDEVRDLWNITARASGDVTFWTITRNESDGPCRFSGVYLTLDIAKAMVRADIEELDGMYRIGDYEIDEVDLCDATGNPVKSAALRAVVLDLRKPDATQKI